MASMLPSDQGAAARLARNLLEADQTDFIVGDAINPQQLAEVVRGVAMRQIYLNESNFRLTELNKQVMAEHLSRRLQPMKAPGLFNRSGA